MVLKKNIVFKFGFSFYEQIKKYLLSAVLLAIYAHLGSYLLFLQVKIDREWLILNGLKFFGNGVNFSDLFSEDRPFLNYLVNYFAAFVFSDYQYYSIIPTLLFSFLFCVCYYRLIDRLFGSMVALFSVAMLGGSYLFTWHALAPGEDMLSWSLLIMAFLHVTIFLDCKRDRWLFSAIVISTIAMMSRYHVWPFCFLVVTYGILKSQKSWKVKGILLLVSNIYVFSWIMFSDVFWNRVWGGRGFHSGPYFYDTSFSEKISYCFKWFHFIYVHLCASNLLLLLVFAIGLIFSFFRKKQLFFWCGIFSFFFLLIGSFLGRISTSERYLLGLLPFFIPYYFNFLEPLKKGRFLFVAPFILLLFLNSSIQSKKIPTIAIEMRLIKNHMVKKYSIETRCNLLVDCFNDEKKGIDNLNQLFNLLKCHQSYKNFRIFEVGGYDVDFDAFLRDKIVPNFIVFRESVKHSPLEKKWKWSGVNRFQWLTHSYVLDYSAGDYRLFRKENLK